MRVSRSLPCSWKRFCELEVGLELWLCSKKLLHVPSRLEVFNFWNSQGVMFWLLWGGGGWRVYCSMNTEVRIASNIWIRNCVDGFSQETLENKWSLNARNQKLTGFLFCVFRFGFLEFKQGFKAFSFSIFRPLYSGQWSSIYRQRFSSLERSKVQPSYARRWLVLEVSSKRYGGWQF